MTNHDSRHASATAPSAGGQRAARLFSAVGFWVVAGLAAVVFLELVSFGGLAVWREWAAGRDDFPFRNCRPAGEECGGSERYADMQSASPVYDGQPWADDYWREARAAYRDAVARYEPFRVWGNKEARGAHINVHAMELGLWRRTPVAMPDGCAEDRITEVWALGGSTMRGEGSPDSMTLPAYLAKHLQALGWECARVRNLGVTGYNSNQELILLIELLKKGARPDVVVLLDGVNDTYIGAFSPGIPEAHDNFDQIRARIERRARLAPVLEAFHTFHLMRGVAARLGNPAATQAASGSATAPEGLQAAAAATIRNYRENVLLVHALSREYGFKAWCFWQPALLYGNKPLTPFERTILNHPELLEFASWDEAAGRRLADAARAVYAEAKRSASGEYIFLGNAFDDSPEPIYIDWMHVGPRGNEILAGIIARHLSRQ